MCGDSPGRYTELKHPDNQVFVELETKVGGSRLNSLRREGAADVPRMGSESFSDLDCGESCQVQTRSQGAVKHPSSRRQRRLERLPKLLRSVLRPMFSRREDRQILGAVVKLVVVLVMDMQVRSACGQPAHLVCNEAVLGHPTQAVS